MKNLKKSLLQKFLPLILLMTILVGLMVTITVFAVDKNETNDNLIESENFESFSSGAKNEILQKLELDSVTGELISFSYSNKAFIPFPATPPTTISEYEKYCIDLAKEMLSEMYNLDDCETMFINNDTVIFCKTMNGYKTYSVIAATFTRESTIKGVTYEGGLHSIRYIDYSDEYKKFESIKIDNNKLQTAVDESFLNINKNINKYDSFEISTDKFLVIVNGSLYVKVIFTPTATLRESGEKNEQAQLVALVRIS